MTALRHKDYVLESFDTSQELVDEERKRVRWSIGGLFKNEYMCLFLIIKNKKYKV